MEKETRTEWIAMKRRTGGEKSWLYITQSYNRCAHDVKKMYICMYVFYISEHVWYVCVQYVELSIPAARPTQERP